MLSGTIVGINASGEGFLSHDGNLLSFPGALPGDTISFSVSLGGNARMEEFLSPSEARVKSDCPFHGPCGGCGLLELSERSRKEVKADLVRRTIEQFAPASQKIPFSFHPAHKLERYRPRIRLHQGRTAGIQAAGYLPASNWKGETLGGIVPITSCALLVPALAKRLRALCRAVGQMRAKVEGVHLLAGAKKGDIAVAHIVAGKKAYRDALEDVGRQLMRAADLVGVSYGDSDGSVKGVIGSVAIPGLIATGSANGPYMAEPSFFCQGNPWQNEKLIREVVRLASPGNAMLSSRAMPGQEILRFRLRLPVGK